MDKHFIKLARPERTPEVTTLIANHHNAFILLTIIAIRARRTTDRITGLKPGECFIGDHRNYGMSEQQYRTAKKQLSDFGLATFKGTTKGTVATIADTSIYDINIKEANDQPNEQVTDNQRTTNEQVTTNKECNNERMEECNNTGKLFDDANTKQSKPDETMEACKRILAYIKEQAGRKFRKYSDELHARLKQGDLTEQECKDIIDWKIVDWGNNPDMKKYINLVTLFRKQNYDRYRTEAEEWIEQGRPETADGHDPEADDPLSMRNAM